MAPPTREELDLPEEDLAPTREPANVDLMAPPSEEELAGSAPQDLMAPPTKEELLDLSGTPSEKVGEVFKDDVTNLGAAQSMIPAFQENMAEDNGWFENAIYTMTLPEQFVARQVVGALEEASALSTEDARDILARDQVHGSDIVNFYWKTPESWLAKGGRFLTGLAADILIDPLSYVGVGALTKLGKTASVGGKAIKGLEKMGKAERAYFKTLQEVEKVVQADGQIVRTMEGAEGIAESNRALIAQARDTQMGFSDLEAKLNISPTAKEEMLSAVRTGMTEKSWAQEWSEGTRGLTLGARIPFTDLAFEADMPAHISKLASLPIQALDGTFGFGKAVVRSTELGDAAYNMVAGFATRTGKFLYDVQQNIRLGSKNAVDEVTSEFEKRGRILLTAKAKQMETGGFAQLMGDIVDEIEMAPLDIEEATKLAQDFKVTDQKLIDQVTTATPKDLERQARLSQHPEVIDLIDDMREMLKGSLQDYRDRGIPMKELNPFGVDEKGNPWARRYIKHVISTDFLNKFKEVNAGSDLIGEVVEQIPALRGKVDPSAAGRSYRGTIREANAEALNNPKYGVKMFVDDPLELVSRRVKEMNKIIQDHDLMEAAIPYAVKGDLPRAAATGDKLVDFVNKPRGYVKYNPEHFSRMVLDESTEDFDKWKQFVPKFFQESDKAIYLPEDVYNRMLFSINGWNVDKPLVKWLNAADFYTNVWRNNALFGPAYLGLNAFSNALTYLSFNDKGGVKALAEATSLLLPWTKNASKKFKVLDEVGKSVEISGERLFREAVEDNILKSSLNKSLDWGDFAEHVASNREARKNLGQKATTIADHAFLWRYSRGLAQFADDIPKLATYVSRRQMGFSRQGAAEAAESLFYNFNNVSRGQDLVRKTIPFSTFPMKTAELVSETLKSGHWASLAIPGKVQAALDGAFVQPHDLRKSLDEMLPGYREHIMHPIHGQIMPGMREVQLDIPWATSTMSALFNPADSIHPVAQLLLLAKSYLAETEEEQAEGAEDRRRILSAQLDLALPTYARDALALAEMSGAINLGGLFKDKYTSQIPTRKQIESSVGPGARKNLEDQSPIYHKFVNAADFGQAMDKKYGENWLYNLLFRNRIDDDTIASAQEAGARGEFLRRKVRQITLGLASLNKLDSNFFMNLFAIKKQEEIKTKELKKQLVQSGHMFDGERITEPKYLQKLAEARPVAKELLALTYKKDSLVEYYTYMADTEKNFRGLDPATILFGTNEHDFDYGDLPDKEVYEKLFSGKTKANLPDEEADSVIEEITTKEGL